MKHYSLKRAEKAMTEEEAEELLARASVARLGLSLDDQPYIVPVNYVYHDRRAFLHSAEEGQKIDYLNHNPNICFEVDEFLGIREAEAPCELGARYRSVIAYGKAMIIRDREGKEEALRRLVAKYAADRQNSPLDEDMVESVVVVEIRFDRVTGKKSL